MSGKGSARRKENTAAVEANWPFHDRKRYGVRAVHEGQGEAGPQDWAGQVQPDAGQGVATEARG